MIRTQRLHPSLGRVVGSAHAIETFVLGPNR
jgi:hypothetical protein